METSLPRRTRKSPSIVPLLLAAVLQPAGESAIGASWHDAEMQLWEVRGQCPAIMTLPMATSGACGAGWDSIACIHVGLMRSTGGGVHGIGARGLSSEDCRVAGEEGEDASGYSLREGYYMAIFVRLGLILLEFASRPLKNAKKILSCCIICFAIYHIQSPDAGKLRPKRGSSKDMLAMSIGLHMSGKGSVPWTEDAGGAAQSERIPATPDSEVSTSVFGIWTLIDDGGESVESTTQLSGSSTWTFASIYLVTKLINKIMCLTRLDKTHKKMRLIKLTKLAKIGKIAYNPISKRSIKVAWKVCRYLKLLKLLKLSKKSKKLLTKKHWKLLKVLKAEKIFKLLRLMGVAYALS